MAKSKHIPRLTWLLRSPAIAVCYRHSGGNILFKNNYVIWLFFYLNTCTISYSEKNKCIFIHNSCKFPDVFCYSKSEFFIAIKCTRRKKIFTAILLCSSVKSLLQWPKEMVSGESKATSLMCAWSLPSSSPLFIGNLMNHPQRFQFSKYWCLFSFRCMSLWLLLESMEAFSISLWWWYTQQVKYISFFND